MIDRALIVLTVAGLTALADSNSIRSASGALSAGGSPAQDQVEALRVARRTEQVRTECIEGRRYVAGRVLQVTPQGLVVDSGYSQLMRPPLNQSWVVPGTAAVERDAHAVEEKKPGAVCVGLVLLSNFPKRPPVKTYDYVMIPGYPAGEHVYKPVPGVEKTIRRFSASLERAVEMNMASEKKTSAR